MQTINWKDLQYKKPKHKKKTKNSQVVKVEYKLKKENFSESQWKEYQLWIKEQKKKLKSQETSQNHSKPSKGKTVKAKVQKPLKTPKKAISRKDEYQEELKDKRWKELSFRVLRRDGFRCAICHSKYNLNVHHLEYTKGLKAWEYPTSVLITLCNECHQKAHSNKNNELYPKYN